MSETLQHSEEKLRDPTEPSPEEIALAEVAARAAEAGITNDIRKRVGVTGRFRPVQKPE